MSDEVVDIFVLQAQVALAVAEEDAVARLARRDLGAPHDRSEKRVHDVGDNEADRLRFLRHESDGRLGSAHSRARGSPARRGTGVSASTAPLPLMTRDTVIADTPAILPTSRIVPALSLLLANIANYRGYRMNLAMLGIDGNVSTS